MTVAKAALLTGKYGSALKHASAANAHLPKFGMSEPETVSLSRTLEGLVLLGLGRHQEARTVLDEFLDIDHHARRVAAQIAIEVGDDDEELELLDRPGTTPPDRGGRLRMGDLSVRRGRLEESPS